MIESLFGYNLHNSMKTDGGKSKTPSPSKHVLDPKRLQNISILSKALGVTVEQVCEALIKGKAILTFSSLSVSFMTIIRFKFHNRKWIVFATTGGSS